ncbi:aldo/keto reductase [Chryseobacterium tructae]|uniref:Aldo/keto reductase n=1 Tax=Chryseobacterium tructae TaxID=1037380 RepID=A0ABV7XXI1_9FLAO|nr:aldo/keto reductase [Chryseobacterium tructae]MDN3692242.1 aldo/keto reductase [Chryseobacterium tructae]
MKSRKLGNMQVSAMGYGCMGLSMGYGAPPTREESIQLIQQAFDLGCTFFDTAEIYAAGANEELIGKALREVRHDTVIASKFLIREAWTTGAKELKRDIQTRLENSLRNLNTDHLDLYYQHRVNKDIPVEDIAGIMGDFIQEGKILGWGQSQATPDEIKRAHAVTPLTAIQSEYSIMERMFEKEVIPLCQELNIGFVPFSPLAGGFLSGKINADTPFTGFDARRVITRYKKENILANQPLLSLLQEFAFNKNATPAQISLAWMLHKYDFIVPIPGSKNKDRLKENLGAADIVLTHEEFSSIENELSTIQIYGNRRDEDLGKLSTL